MTQNRFEEILDEVIDEIETSLKDARGVVVHQRRLAFLLSLGSVSLIEYYLWKKSVLIPGSKLNHLWFKKKKVNVKILITKLLSCPVSSIPEIDELLDLAFELEKERNHWAYGKIVSEGLLREKINSFLNLKQKVENV